MQKLKIKTHKKKEVLDITDTVEKALGRRNSSDSGICNLFILHTTAALTTADLDPGTDLDMLDAFEEMIPKLRYRRSEEHTSELQSRPHLVCRLLLEKKKTKKHS